MNELVSVSASILAWINVPFSEVVIKSTLTIALAALACKLLRRQSAALRHRLWVFGLAASLVVPVAVWVLPQFTLAVLPGGLVPSTVATARKARPGPLIPAGESSLPGGEFGAGSVTPRSESDTKSIVAATVGARPADEQSEKFPSALAGTARIESMCVAGWLLGMLIGATLFIVSLARQSMRLRRLPRINDAGWAKAISVAGNAIGLERPVVSLELAEACIPAVVGVFSPRLVIPSNWRTWNPTQRHCILLHELAHVKRREVVAQLLGRCTRLVYWFNPLVWHATRQLRAERELASDDCVLMAGQAASDYAEQLLCTMRSYRPLWLEAGVAMAHSARLDQRVLAILDPKRRRDPVNARWAILLPCLAGAIGMVLGAVTLTTSAVVANQTAESNKADVGPLWKETSTIEYPGTLPVSVAFSTDGKTLLTGDTTGEVMALIFADHEPRWRWKSKVDGSHAAVTFSADQNHVYATTEHGVRILDAASGKEQDRIEAKDSSPTAIGVFPNKTVAGTLTRMQIVFGTPRGYFVKSWVEGKLADTMGTIETSTVAKVAKSADEAAVPLAVDPNGRSAIMTGPVDATGAAGGEKGKNVLWAYVCGDYDAGSPGNRMIVGHTATVVSAAWAKEGSTAVTGDAAGRVIIWDAKTMKETRRLELGGRVAALAISDDGTRVAAYVLGKQGEVYVWETAQSVDALKPIYTDLGDFGGPHMCASLSFSPDGKQLAGCAIDKRWLSRLGELVGKVRVWELVAAPKAQNPPNHAFNKELPKGSSLNFVVPNNDSVLTPAAKEGALDFRDIAEGRIQTRIVLGKFAIGNMRLSTDRKWLAMEQRPPKNDSNSDVSNAGFDVGVYASPLLHKATIPGCSQLVDIASGGKVVAVVREKKVELWDIGSAKMLKAAPFQPAQIDAASFSPDGRVLAIADRNDLVLWRWEENAQERIQLGRRVGSLVFSPDGKNLAEGPTPGENIRIRDVATREVVQMLADSRERLMFVPQMAYAQGGRVLIVCDNSTKESETPHRISVWDTVDGSLAHQLTIKAGSPQHLDVSPDGRYLVATVVQSDGVTLSGWRLDGEDPVKELGPTAPASVVPR